MRNTILMWAIILSAAIGSSRAAPAQATAGSASALALTIAVSRGDIAAVKALLAHGADPNAADENGHTPLGTATSGTDLAMVRTLVQAGADVNRADGARFTPLQSAAVMSVVPRSHAVIQELLKAGADPNIPGNHGQTPLMAVARAGTLDTVNLLLAAGAKVDARSDDGLTVLMWAIRPVGQAPGVVGVLLKRGAPVDAARPDGTTALMMAAANGQTATVKLLLAHGAARALKNRKGETARQIALRAKHPDLARLLDASPKRSRR